MIFYLPHQATVLWLWQKAGLFCTLRESSWLCSIANMEKHQGRKWLMYSLKCVFFRTIWENCFKIIRQHLLAFDMCWFRKCIFVRHDNREGQAMAVCLIPIIMTAETMCYVHGDRYDVIKNIISRLIAPSMYFNKKSLIWHNWLCRLNAVLYNQDLNEIWRLPSTFTFSRSWGWPLSFVHLRVIPSSTLRSGMVRILPHYQVDLDTVYMSEFTVPMFLPLLVSVRCMKIWVGL